MPVLFHLLDRLAILLSDSGEILYRCIGIQQILDVFRLHIVRSTEQELKAVTSIGLEKDLLDVSGDLLNVTDSTHFKRTITVRDCADAVFRLLHSALLAARTIATKLKGTVRHEIEILLTCLDETSNSHVAETVLSIIFELKETVPVVLVQALLSLRYYDTIIVNVLTRKQFTQIIRIRGTTILFWLLSGELKSISSMLLEARKKLIKVVLATMDMNNSASVIHLIDSYHFDGALLPATQPQKNKRKSTVAGSNLSLESARINNLCVQIKEYTKPLEKMWLVLVMITESIKRAIENGSWSSNETNRKFLESDVDALLNSIVVESQPQIWLTLPMMPILLANGSLPTAQTIIMGINVCFKSEENQSEIVASIPERSWIKTFLSIAAVGEKVLREDQDKYSAEDSKKRHLMGDTCVELALDTLAIVVEYKIRQHLNDTKHIWSCLFDCIKVVIEPLFEKVPHLLPLVEAQYQQRLVSLVLQRIVKNNEVWMSPLFAGQVIKIFSLIDEMDLCGSYRHPNSTGKAPSDLVDINDRTIILLNQTTEETQITSFLLDILSSSRRLRRHPIGISIKSVEWKVLKFALHLVLQSLAMTNEDLAERVCQEVIGFLAIISDQNAKFPARKYKATVMNILQSLRKVIKSIYCRESIRSQYTALMFMIMHFFIDLRHSIAMSNSFENIPDHVVPMMDDLIGIDNCNDIDLIFKLLDVAMRTADPISFEENDQEGAMMLDDDHDHDDNKSISAADEPLLSFDDIEENGNNIIPSQDKVSEVMPAIQTKQVASEGKTSDSLSEISPQSMSSADLASVFGQISQQEDKSREKAFQKWISIRTGISSERIDSERARMTRAMDALDLSYAATDKYWKKVSRKIESECFLQYHRCQWKLGVSHEGYFPGRRRIVLRPRYDYRDYLISNAALQRETNLAQYEDPVLDSSRNVRRMSSGGFNSILSVDEQDNLLFTSPTKEIGSKGDDLDRALARACAGYIKDVTQGDASEATSMERASMDTSNSDNYSNDKIKSGADKSSAITVPGTSWGLVDADDSEEGFGVVGLTMGETAPTGSNFRAVSNEKSDVKISEADSLDFNPLQQRGDMMGDVKQLEENFRQGRAIETGPCYSGTRRVGSGPALLDASVILITASGNFRGTLSFNGKEIFFCSTTLADDSHKKDSASVNLGQNERMRRRRWVVRDYSSFAVTEFLSFA